MTFGVAFPGFCWPFLSRLARITHPRPLLCARRPQQQKDFDSVFLDCGTFGKENSTHLPNSPAQDVPVVRPLFPTPDPAEHFCAPLVAHGGAQRPLRRGNAPGSHEPCLHAGGLDAAPTERDCRRRAHGGSPEARARRLSDRRRGAGAAQGGAGQAQSRLRVEVRRGRRRRGLRGMWMSSTFLGSEAGLLTLLGRRKRLSRRSIE